MTVFAYWYPVTLLSGAHKNGKGHLFPVKHEATRFRGSGKAKLPLPHCHAVFRLQPHRLKGRPLLRQWAYGQSPMLQQTPQFTGQRHTSTAAADAELQQCIQMRLAQRTATGSFCIKDPQHARLQSRMQRQQPGAFDAGCAIFSQCLPGKCVQTIIIGSQTASAGSDIRLCTGVGLLQLGQHPMADAVATECHVRIGCVFSIRKAVSGKIGQDFLSSGIQHRTDDIIALGRNPPKSGHTAAAYQMKQHSFCLITPMMPGGNGICLPSLRGFLQKCIPQMPSGFFRSAALCRSISSSITAAAEKRDAQCITQSLAKGDFRFRSLRTKTMREMGRRHRQPPFRCQRAQGMGQRHRIRTAAEGTKDPATCWQQIGPGKELIAHYVWSPGWRRR